jgi:aspartate carbamoyltransferase catalytic subunit
LKIGYNPELLNNPLTRIKSGLTFIGDDHLNQSGLQHLLDIESLSYQQLQKLLALSMQIARDPGKFANRLSDRLQINLFLEPSTRTRVSFEVAAKRLGMHVVNFQPGFSSTVKGETLTDTFHTLQAMRPDVIAIRDARDRVVESLSLEADPGVHIINAGDGSFQHPTQALLDALTLQKVRGEDLSGQTITIAGDIKHSRVARSGVALFRKLGVKEIRLAGPAALLPGQEMKGVRLCTSLDEAVSGANVVMMLRIQKERFGQLQQPDEGAYFEAWGLTAKRLARAAADCVVLHPGPVNRGVEIASEVADGGQSLIREQVRNGVFARMAVLLTLLDL